MNKILTIIGARPQFIKASVVSRALANRSDVQEIIVHTGQHFDPNMSEVFLNQLNLPQPNYQLNINGGNHGEMTGRMLIEIERTILSENPDLVLVYGDTNSTLAGALAAKKLHVPVAHVEAGLRSFNMLMPEEINRILTDQISDLLFCPTKVAMLNLAREGFSNKLVDIELVGDVMQDSAIMFGPFAQKPAGLAPHNDFVLATIHRAENTDDIARLSNIVKALNEVHKCVAPVVLPLHPRTAKAVFEAGLYLTVNRLDPVGYLEMLWLLKNCSLVATDSGGLQKEAFFFNKACLTVRDQTEWTELVDIGANTLVNTDIQKIVSCATSQIGRVVEDNIQLYGGGTASKSIVSLLARNYC